MCRQTPIFGYVLERLTVSPTLKTFGGWSYRAFRFAGEFQPDRDASLLGALGFRPASLRLSFGVGSGSTFGHALRGLNGESTLKSFGAASY